MAAIFQPLPRSAGPLAVNRGNNAAGQLTDARGFTRLIGTNYDIGAIENQAPTIVVSDQVTAVVMSEEEPQ